MQYFLRFLSEESTQKFEIMSFFCFLAGRGVCFDLFFTLSTKERLIEMNGWLKSGKTRAHITQKWKTRAITYQNVHIFLLSKAGIILTIWGKEWVSGTQISN